MKFYLIEIAEGDAEINGNNIYEYETLEEAKTNYHIKLGDAMKSDLYTSELVMVINSEGGIHCFEKYTAPVKTPVEPVIEEPVIDDTADEEPVAEVTEEEPTVEEPINEEVTK